MCQGNKKHTEITGKTNKNPTVINLVEGFCLVYHFAANLEYVLTMLGVERNTKGGHPSQETCPKDEGKTKITTRGALIIKLKIGKQNTHKHATRKHHKKRNSTRKREPKRGTKPNQREKQQSGKKGEENGRTEYAIWPISPISPSLLKFSSFAKLFRHQSCARNTKLRVVLKRCALLIKKHFTNQLCSLCYFYSFSLHLLNYPFTSSS